MKCSNCDNTEFEYIERTFINGTKHYQRKCKNCGTFNQYAPSYEVNPNEDPGKFVMPFGKHKDKTLIQIGQDDYDYLLWAVDNLNSKTIRKRIEMFLNPIRITYDTQEVR